MEPADLRRVLGHFVTGVTVVTAMHEGRPHGLTVNAFSSLSLEPPQVLVCLKRANRSYAAFAAAGSFAVNVLADHQVGLSRLFASQQERKFEGLLFTPGAATGAPLLEGVHAWLECSVVERIETAGTHAIVIGALLGHGSGAAEPLLFHRGGYHRLGERIS